MQRQQYSSQDTAYSSEQRLAAFGVIIGEATVVWNWNGRPILKPMEAASPQKDREVWQSPKEEDLAGRIAEILGKNGPQSPGAIGIRVGRSHRVVYEALKWLLIHHVAGAVGSTRNRRYTLSKDWKAALMRARERDCLDQKKKPKKEDAQNA